MNKRIYVLAMVFVALLSCEKQSNLLIESIETDYTNKEGKEISGKPLLKSILGCHNILVLDSLLIAITDNPDAQLLVLNANTLDTIGAFCKRGRAKNEFMKAYSPTKQIYEKNGHIIVPLIDYLDVVKEVDITESINRGYTVVISNESCLRFVDGQTFFIDNDINKRFEYLYNKYDGEEIKKVPCVYSINNYGQKTKEIKIFRRLLQVEREELLECPFGSMLLKNPTNNTFVNMFENMDYLIFFDLDKKKTFAVHQQGSSTFDDPFSYDREYYFNNGCCTSNYALLLYYHGDDSMKEPDKMKRKAELIIFDWNGNFIENIKLDRRLASIGFDETNKKLFGLTFTEELYEYDLSTLLP